MTQSNDILERIRKLEESIVTLREAKVRAEERLSVLREQRDAYVKELAAHGISLKDAKEYLAKMATEIDSEITEIERQIPQNLPEV